MVIQGFLFLFILIVFFHIIYTNNELRVIFEKVSHFYCIYLFIYFILCSRLNSLINFVFNLYSYFCFWRILVFKATRNLYNLLLWLLRIIPVSVNLTWVLVPVIHFLFLSPKPTPQTHTDRVLPLHPLFTNKLLPLYSISKF